MNRIGIAGVCLWGAVSLAGIVRADPPPESPTAASLHGSAEASFPALGIPRQAALAPPLPATASEPEAERLWRQALESFWQGEPPDGVVARLRELWTRWPELEYAVKAQMFALETLHSDFLKPPGRWSSLDFMEAALRSHRLYFSERYEKSVQHVALRALRWLDAADQPEVAWRLCVRLRWEAPRVDQLAPACRALISRHPRLELSPEATLALLGPTVELMPLPAEGLSPAPRGALRQYLAQPYDEDRLNHLVVTLRQAGRFALADSLIEEWFEFNPAALWCLKAPMTKKLIPDDCKVSKPGERRR